MNRINALVGAVALAVATTQAVAEPYDISGTFTAPGTLQTSLGGADILDSGSITIAGRVNTDSANPGYSVTGGTVRMDGSIVALSGAATIDISVSGDATDTGVLFNSGTICVTTAAPGNCDAGLIDASTNPLDFRNGAAWGFFNAVGMQFLGGSGGAGFTVAQPGSLAANGPTGATGAAVLLGNDAGIFLSGNLTFSEPPPVISDPNAIPTLPAYGLGLTMLGLVLLAARRLRQVASRKV